MKTFLTPSLSFPTFAGKRKPPSAEQLQRYFGKLPEGFDAFKVAQSLAGTEQVFTIPIRRKKTQVRVMDGEKLSPPEPGMSHGFVHLVNPQTGQKAGFTGINTFFKLAKPLTP